MLVESAHGRRVRIRDEDVDIFEVVRLERRCDLQLLIVELDTIQDGLLLKLDLPRGSSDRIARTYGRDHKFSVLDLEALVLIEGNELNLREGSFHIL